MDSLIEVVATVGFFALRLLVPVGVIVLLSWGLRRLDAHWLAQAEAESRAALSVEIPPQAIVPLASEQPCWEQRHCAPGKCESCPAYQHAALPCWLARREAEGALPEACLLCGIFKATGGPGTTPSHLPAH